MTNILDFSPRPKKTAEGRLQAIREVLEPLGFAIMEVSGSNPSDPTFDVYAQLSCGISYLLPSPSGGPSGTTLAELEQLPWAVSAALDALMSEADGRDSSES